MVLLLPEQDAGKAIRRDFLERARHMSSIGSVIKKLRANMRRARMRPPTSTLA
jgi:hypothetical protein